MKKNKKWLIILTLAFIMLFPCVFVENVQAAASKKYLVLVETQKGKWVAYENLTETKNGKLMIAAKKTAKALDYKYTYKKSTKKLTIKKSNKNYIVFRRNSKKYNVVNKNRKKNQTAAEKMYYSSKKKSYMVSYKTLFKLVNGKYYKASKAPKYKAMGYQGVICYSTVGKIKKVPSISNVYNTNGTKFTLIDLKKNQIAIRNGAKKTYVDRVGSSYTDYYEAVQKHLDWLNQERKKAGAAPLKLNLGLSMAATYRAIEMGEEGWFSHYTPSGDNAFLRACNYYGLNTNTYMAENIAFRVPCTGISDLVKLGKQFKDSEPHYNTILDKNGYTATEVGIGFYINSKKEAYCVELFRQ